MWAEQEPLYWPLICDPRLVALDYHTCSEIPLVTETDVTLLLEQLLTSFNAVLLN